MYKRQIIKQNFIIKICFIYFQLEVQSLGARFEGIISSLSH